MMLSYKKLKFYLDGGMKLGRDEALMDGEEMQETKLGW